MSVFSQHYTNGFWIALSILLLNGCTIQPLNVSRSDIVGHWYGVNIRDDGTVYQFTSEEHRDGKIILRFTACDGEDILSYQEEYGYWEIKGAHYVTHIRRVVDFNIGQPPEQLDKTYDDDYEILTMSSTKMVYRNNSGIIFEKIKVGPGFTFQCVLSI